MCEKKESKIQSLLEEFQIHAIIEMNKKKLLREQFHQGKYFLGKDRIASVLTLFDLELSTSRAFWIVPSFGILLSASVLSLSLQYNSIYYTNTLPHQLRRISTTHLFCTSYQCIYLLVIFIVIARALLASMQFSIERLCSSKQQNRKCNAMQSYCSH